MRSWTALACMGAMSLLLSSAAIADEAQPVAGAQAPADVAAFDDIAAEEAPAVAEAEIVEIDEIEQMAETETGAEIEGADAFDMADTPSDPLASDMVDAAAEPAEIEAMDAAAADTDADAMAWDAPAESGPTPEEMGAVPAPAVAPSAVLGPMAVDEEGRMGRIHTVIPGDTLWDISAAYLGTPWVWPSVWQDNKDIQDPHRIDPNDRIWITAGEMRVVTESEADRMISAHGELAAAPAEFDELEPAEYVEGPLAAEDDMMQDEVPAAMDELPVAVPLQAKSSLNSGLSVRIAGLESMGFVTADAIDAATTIVESPNVRDLLVEGDRVYIGLGEGDVQVGDELQIFRDIAAVADVEGNVLLGYHVDVLGWAVVREITGDTSIAEIRMSRSEIFRGDRMVPRETVRLNVPIRFSPEGLPGNIVFLPQDRTTMGEGDYVYLNRGTLHGFEEGSAVEVFQSGELVKDKATGRKVMTPDHIIGKLVMVAVRPDSSVAFIVRSSTELQVGDRIRPANQNLASN